MTDNTFMIIAISFQTMVFIPTYACARHPDNFHHPDDIIPDRWLEDDVNKFGSLPFSFGARTCIGRRVAELEIRIALAHVSDVWSQFTLGMYVCVFSHSPFCVQIIRRFNLSYLNTEPISLGTERLVIFPDKPVLLGLNNAS